MNTIFVCSTSLLTLKSNYYINLGLCGLYEGLSCLGGGKFDEGFLSGVELYGSTRYIVSCGPTR